MLLKTILLDIDGVLADLDAVWLPWIRETFGDDITEDKIKSWNIDQFCPNGGKRVYEFLETPRLYDNVEPFPGSVDFVKWLSDSGHNVKFVTSNPKQSMESKLDWIDRHFWFIGSRSHVYIGHEIYKQRIRADVLIDDNLNNLRGFSGFKILLDKPYNQEVDFGLYRAFDFSDIKSFISYNEEKKTYGWQSYFMRIAREVSTRGSCDRAQVGCLIVRDKRIIATGYNGAMSGDDHCDEEGHLMRDGHCIRTIHAEDNALIQAASHGIPVDGASAYVTHLPCWNCYKKLVTAGIKEIYYDFNYRPDPLVRSTDRVRLIQLPC